MPQYYPEFSIVIPYSKEPRYLRRLLGDIQAQPTPAQAVMVLDCSRMHSALPLTERFGRSLPLSVIRTSARLAVAACNAATASLHCRPEDYLVCIDPAMRLQRDFLGNLRTAARQHPADFIQPTFVSGGRRRVDAPALDLPRDRRRLPNLGSTMIVRKAMHDKLGGFPEDADAATYTDRVNGAGATAYRASKVQIVAPKRYQSESGPLRQLLGALQEEAVVAEALRHIIESEPTIKVS